MRSHQPGVGPSPMVPQAGSSLAVTMLVLSALALSCGEPTPSDQASDPIPGAGRALLTGSSIEMPASGPANERIHDTDPPGEETNLRPGSGQSVSAAPSLDGLAPEGGDQDQDGIDDDYEMMIASSYLPFRSTSPREHCVESGIVFRLRPHPLNPAYFHVLYDVLYDNDCGLDSHPGDNEAFAITVDPSKPAPQGILAMVGIAHQGTACNSKTECVTCGGGADACEMASYQGASWPVVYASRDKHGNYLFDGVFGSKRCDFNCFGADRCDMASVPTRVPMVNVGEPDYPLTRDLTEAGLITEEHGFEEAVLYNYDPWGPEEFGDAGVVSGDLVDTAFDTLAPVCN